MHSRKSQTPLRLPLFVLAGLLACCVMTSACLAGATADQAPAKPNLITIVTDDQARWAVGIYGNSECRTPNMDRIGREGIVMTNAIAATPVCSPSRATWLTGRYPTELGITDWISPAEAEAGLGLKGQTWAMVLREHGYATGLIGKWHLGTQPQFHPRELGFDHFMGFLPGGTRPMNPVLEVGGKATPLKGPLPDLLTDDALKFIERNRKKPFALSLHYRAPHTPWKPLPEEDLAPFKDLDPEVPLAPGADAEQIRNWNRDYYASIHSVDRNIGRVLDALDRWQLADNTIVLFTSDHGYNNGRHNVSTKGNGHWVAGGVRGPKRPNMWDTSIRIPLLIRWPDVISAGSSTSLPVSTIDMFRTVLGLTGIDVPADSPAHGIDFSRLLRGEPLASREALFGQYDLHNNGLAYLRMIRTSRYKLVTRARARGLDELYDLEQDPHEERNLLRRGRRGGPDVSAIERELRGQLRAWQESIGDPVLTDRY